MACYILLYRQKCFIVRFISSLIIGLLGRAKRINKIFLNVLNFLMVGNLPKSKHHIRQKIPHKYDDYRKKFRHIEVCPIFSLVE